MRYALFLASSILLLGQQAPPLAQILKDKPAVTQNNQDLQRFRTAVGGSRPVLQRGGQAGLRQHDPMFQGAYGYLNGLEGGSLNDARRRELAYAYQDLGDLAGGPYGWNAGNRAYAIQCYQRAMFLLGAGGGNGRRGGSDRDLETLATRLTLLNAPFMMGGAFGGQQEPEQPSRPAIAVERSGAIPPPPPLPQGLSPAEAKDANEVREQYVTASGRAQALLGSVDDLRQSLGARGLTLHEDLAGSVGRMRLYFELAVDSMQNGAGADAKRQIEKADYEAGKLARQLGR